MKFGRLTVIDEQLAKTLTKGSRTKIKVLCDCGNLLMVMYWSLTSGHTKSCGCLQKEKVAVVCQQFKTHGMHNTRFYRIWAGIKARCLNPNEPAYSDYGGRGITVYDKWKVFENFRAGLYESYLKHVAEFGERDTTIERKNPNGNYEPSNVTWATRKEQGKTRRDSSITKNYKEHRRWKKRLQDATDAALSLNRKSSHLLEPYLGCTIPQFHKHIESQFTEGMNWDNHGKGADKWELDHVIGCNNFDLDTEEGRKKCWNYTNLQPLWYDDHKKKNKKRIVLG